MFLIDELSKKDTKKIIHLEQKLKEAKAKSKTEAEREDEKDPVTGVFDDVASALGMNSDGDEDGLSDREKLAHLEKKVKQYS